VQLLLVLLLFTASAWAQGQADSTPDLLAVSSPLVGVGINHVRVWALHDGAWQTVPFQFDRHTADGDWDFTMHASPEGAHRRLTELDELVVATADLGEEAPAGTVPPGAPTPRPVGIPGAGRVYVASHDAPPPLSARRWISYNYERDEVAHPGYLLGFDAARPFLFDRLVWTADPHETDWIDTGKIRARGLLLGKLPFHRTQADFTSRIVGVIAGPVRAVVRTENRLRMVLGIQTPSSIIDRIHTPNTLVMDIVIRLPFNVGWLFHDLEVRSTLDLRPGDSRTITCPDHPPARIDGRVEPNEETLRGGPMRGFTIAGRYGTMHGDLTLAPGLDLRPALYYADDATEADPPEGHPGHYGETGVTLTGWEKLHRGDYRMRLTLDFLPGDRQPPGGPHSLARRGQLTREPEAQ
jgi:hypothetical protein